MNELLSRNFIVTDRNIGAVPKPALIARCNRIKRTLNKSASNEKPELRTELTLIVEYLGEEVTTLSDQLELDIPQNVREQYVPLIETRLGEHRVLRKRLARLKSQLPTSYNPVESKVTASYGNLSGVNSGGVHSSTEAAVLHPFEQEERILKEIKQIEEAIYPMERILEWLNEDQQELINERYLMDSNEKDYLVKERLGWSRTKYYDVKGAALIQIASSLRII